jgi:hypothetical protein
MHLHLTTRTLALEEAEIIPGKKFDTRIKPLPLTLTNSHGRYITATPERTFFSVGEWPLHIALHCNRYKILTVSVLKRLLHVIAAVSVSEVKRPPGPKSGLKY